MKQREITLNYAQRKARNEPERFEVEDWEWKIADKVFEMKMLRDKSTGLGRWTDYMRRTR